MTPQHSEYDGLVWLNGQLVNAGEAQVSLFDRGYLYGEGLFETMRAYTGSIFRWDRHLARLQAGLAVLGIALPYAKADIAAAIQEVLAANRLSDAYLRLSVSGGLGLGPRPPANASPTVSIIARPLALPSPAEYKEGWSAILTDSLLAPTDRWGQIKPLSYLDKLLAKKAAIEAGANEALLVNCRGEIAEASTSNIFIVKQGRLLTPPASAGLLLGVTRQTVLEIAPRLSLAPQEAALTAEDVLAADECFLTNSIMEIMPLCRLQGQPIGSGQPGEMTVSLHKALQNLIKRESA